MEAPMVSIHLQCLRLAQISLLLAAVFVPTAPPRAGEQAPLGQAVMAWHVTIAPSWLSIDRPAANHAVRHALRDP